MFAINYTSKFTVILSSKKIFSKIVRIFARRTKIAITRPIFKNFADFVFYMGPHYVEFTFALNTTIIRLKITEIWPEYVAQAFLPPPPLPGIVILEVPQG